MSASELDQVIGEQHLALDAFVKGNDGPLAGLWSRADDVTLGNPFGPFVRGFEQVAETMKRAAANYRDGEASGFEQLSKHVTTDLAYVVEVERFNARIGGRQEITPPLPSLHQYLPSRGGTLEARPSPRGSDHDHAGA